MQIRFFENMKNATESTRKWWTQIIILENGEYEEPVPWGISLLGGFAISACNHYLILLTIAPINY